jgi:hypothetical protein
MPQANVQIYDTLNLYFIMGCIYVDPEREFLAFHYWIAGDGKTVLLGLVCSSPREHQAVHTDPHSQTHCQQPPATKHLAFTPRV